MGHNLLLLSLLLLRTSGLSWLGVVTILTLPSFATAIQAQPEPKTPAAAALN